MKSKLLKDINAYISYLNEKGFFVTVHGKGKIRIIEHNIHNHPYCALVKSYKSTWKDCLLCQKKVLEKYKEEEFFGMCHAGVEEYVYFVNDKTVISVSGYGINRKKADEKIRRLASLYGFNRKELSAAYEHSLKHQEENMEKLRVLIKPLCYMLSLLEMQTGDLPENEEGKDIFDSIYSYVLLNYTGDITVEDIARYASCSVSTVAHVFKKRTGVPVKKYILNLRLNQAKKLLSFCDLPISTVATLSGFTNINYFPTAFKKAFNITPTEQREQNGEKKTLYTDTL